MPLKLIPCDIKRTIIRAWEEHLAGIDAVEIRHGNIFGVDTDALVSPASSFGFMDGGLDYAISEFFNWEIQGEVQAALREKHLGELPVGQAEIVERATRGFPASCLRRRWELPST